MIGGGPGNASQQVLRIVDHGSGLGVAVAGALASGLEASPRRSTDQLVDVELRIAPGGGDRVEVAINVVGELALGPERWPAVEVGDRLLGLLTRLWLDADRVHPRMHGGAVVDDGGGALVVLGASGAGKSTLIAHLAASGLGLLNDEQVAVHRDLGVVAGFARPVAIKRGGLGHLPAGVAPVLRDGQQVALVTAAQLGTRHVLTGRPSVVVLPERDDTADATDVAWRQLSPGEAVVALCENNLDLEDRPVRALDDFAWLASVAPVVRLRYRDAADAVDTVRGLLAEPPEPSSFEWSVSVEPAAGEGPQPGPGMARRAPGSHTVVLGAEAVVLDPTLRTTVHLDAAGAERWASLPLPLPLPLASDGEPFAAELVELGLAVVEPVS